MNMLINNYDFLIEFNILIFVFFSFFFLIFKIGLFSTLFFLSLFFILYFSCIKEYLFFIILFQYFIICFFIFNIKSRFILVILNYIFTLFFLKLFFFVNISDLNNHIFLSSIYSKGKSSVKDSLEFKLQDLEVKVKSNIFERDLLLRVLGGLLGFMKYYTDISQLIKVFNHFSVDLKNLSKATLEDFYNTGVSRKFFLFRKSKSLVTLSNLDIENLTLEGLSKINLPYITLESLFHISKENLEKLTSLIQERISLLEKEFYLLKKEKRSVYSSLNNSFLIKNPLYLSNSPGTMFDNHVDALHLINFRFQVFLGSSVWKLFKEDINLGKYDYILSSSRSFYSSLNKFIILFNFNLEDPVDKRILELVIAHIFFYLNERKFKGFNVRISTYFDYSFLFSRCNLSSIKSYKEVELCLKRIYKVHNISNLDMETGSRIFFKAFSELRNHFLSCNRCYRDSQEIYSVYTLWNIFISLSLFREYILGNEKLLLLLPSKFVFEYRIISTFFLICIFEFHYFDFLNSKTGSYYIKNPFFDFELIKETHLGFVHLVRMNKIYRPLEFSFNNYKFARSPFLVHFPRFLVFRNISYNNSEVRVKNFPDCISLDFSFKDYYFKSLFTSCHFLFRKDLSYSFTELEKDTFFFRFKSQFRSDLIFVFLPFLFFDSSYRGNRFKRDFFYPGNKFLNVKNINLFFYPSRIRNK